MSIIEWRRKILSTRKKPARGAYSAAPQADQANIYTSRTNHDASPRWIARLQQRLFYENALYAPVGPQLSNATSVPAAEKPAVAYPEYLARRLRRRESLDDGVEEEDHKTPRVLVTVIERDVWDEEDDLIEIASLV